MYRMATAQRSAVLGEREERPMTRQQHPAEVLGRHALSRRGFIRTAAQAGGAMGLASAVSACGDSGGGSGGAVTLQLWDTDTRPERTANLKKLISMFEAKN